MQINRLLIILIFLSTGCYLFGPKTPIICDCCEQTFTNIDSAVNCMNIRPYHPYKNSSIDPRLLLLAFVKDSINEKQKLGWNIIPDNDIIRKAKMEYLLIILDVNNFKVPKDCDTTELNDYIKRNSEELFFIIASEDMHPWSDWNLKNDKKHIIERLGVGCGP
jgi:hypothetical protein